MVVVRRVLHGLGDPGGVGVPWRYEPSLDNGGFEAIKPGVLPLPLDDGEGRPAALREGEVPLLITAPLPPPPAYWLGASSRWTGRGDGAGEVDGVLLLLLLNGCAMKPAW